jgi:hypothetical protein
MTETWFNRPMESNDVPADDPPRVITRCNCKAEFYKRGGNVWDCAAHGAVNEDDYVQREGLQIQCPYCASYRVMHDFVMGHCECLNCWEGWDYD